EQGIDPRDEGYVLRFEGLAEVGQRLWARNQNIVRATHKKTQQVHGESEDMIEWERGQNVIVFAHVVAPETKELRHVHDQIAVRQHRPLAYARGTAGILQTGDGGRLQVSRVALDIGPRANAGRAQREQIGRAHV